MAKTKTAKDDTGAPLGFEAKLWAAADALRNNMDAAEYKHVVLGLIFLKYISDAFEAKHAELQSQTAQGADPEDRDEYRAASIFWVPKEARWQHLKASAPQSTIGTLVDDAMSAIERDNPSLRGVLPKDFGRAGLDKHRLGQIINLVSDIALGSSAERAKDTLGRVYEYFLARFASAEGKSGGQFYTPSHVVRVLVEMLAPFKGRVYDPCCGSGGMFVSSEKFIEAHSGRLGDISIYGQESNYTTWRLAMMNLAIRGIDAQIAHGDTFHNDKHPDLKADYVLANPPFNDSDWRGERNRHVHHEKGVVALPRASMPFVRLYGCGDEPPFATNTRIMSQSLAPLDTVASGKWLPIPDCHPGSRTCSPKPRNACVGRTIGANSEHSGTKSCLAPPSRRCFAH